MSEKIKGNVYIIAAPSGGGKTSLVKALVTNLSNIEVSISHTTRKIRPGETNGLHYFFVSEKAFLDMVNEDAFIEHARVFDQLYGTSVAQINERLVAGIDVVLDIDWQGAEQIRRLFPDSISVFIIPPSLQVLQQRLESRAQDNEQVISERMARAKEETSHYGEFDYLIVNDDFKKACDELQAIVVANRLLISKQSAKQAKLLSFLLT